MQLDTTINICIAKRCFYISALKTACFGRYIGHHQVVYSLVFIFKANYRICNVSVKEIWCTSIKSAFRIITVAVELKSYSEIKDINSITSWVCAFIGTCDPMNKTGMSHLKA